MENKNPYTDTTTRKYQNSDYEKTEQGWVKRIKDTEEQAAVQASPADTKKEYSDDELADFAKKASDEALRKAGAGRDERMRIAAKKELIRRKNEGMPEPEKSDNPFDEGMEKGLFDEFPTKKFGETEYINKGQGWEPLEKGRASVGEIRVWSGEKYQKTATGWKYLGKDGSGSGKTKEEKKAEPYDKAWPESLDKLTNRSSWDEIHDEAMKVSEVRFNEEYPDPEETFFKELIEEDRKYTWRSPHYDELDDQKKAQWKEERKKQWLSRTASSVMGEARRGSAPSKTTMISNIKNAWEGIKKKKDKEIADAKYKEMIESNEGAAKRREYGEAMKANAEEFIAKKNELKQELIDAVDFNWATGYLTSAEKENLKYRIDGNRLRISGLTDRSWDDLEVRYERKWGEPDRVYQLSHLSYGSIEPGSKEAKAFALQGQFVSNPTIIKATKKAIKGIGDAREEMYRKDEELKKKYPEFRRDEVWDEYGADVEDWE